MTCLIGYKCPERWVKLLLKFIVKMRHEKLAKPGEGWSARNRLLQKNRLLCILLLSCRQFEALCKLDWIVDILCAFLKSGKCNLELEYGRVLE